MKKINFLFATLLTIVLVSCSQVDDDEFQPEVPGTEKLYKMSFNVSEFEIESTPLKNQTKTEGEIKGDFLQYVIYKENNGSVILSKTLSKQDVSTVGDTADSNVGFELELPIGKYYIAVLTGPYYQRGYPISSPEYFSTDFTRGNWWTTRDTGNGGIYFDSFSFDVSENIANNVADVTLKPMWSSVAIQVTNAATCDFPTNTAIISYGITPHVNGFYLQSKEPEIYYSVKSGFRSTYDGDMIGFEAFKTGSSHVSFITDKIKNATITVQFYSANTPSSNGELLGEQVIYTGDIERGKNIVLKGKLPESSSEPGNDSSFQLNYVDMENVEIPFTE